MAVTQLETLLAAFVAGCAIVPLRASFRLLQLPRRLFTGIAVIGPIGGLAALAQYWIPDGTLLTASTNLVATGLGFGLS